MKHKLVSMFVFAFAMVFSASTIIVPIHADEINTEEHEIMEQALVSDFDTNEPNFNVNDNKDYEIVYDSRISGSKTRAIPSSYDYYLTIRSYVVVKGSGIASSPLLDAKVNLYCNVFFKLDSNYKPYVVGYENPVITNIENNKAKPNVYRNGSVSVTGTTKNTISFSASCNLHAGGVYYMSGSRTISVP